MNDHHLWKVIAAAEERGRRQALLELADRLERDPQAHDTTTTLFGMAELLRAEADTEVRDTFIYEAPADESRSS